MVHFVGAGSGAKDLITVRGMNLLKNADVSAYIAEKQAELDKQNGTDIMSLADIQRRRAMIARGELKDSFGFTPAFSEQLKAMSDLEKTLAIKEKREEEKKAEESARLAQEYHMDLDIIADVFHPMIRDVRRGLHTEYILPGGRGSTKSSGISCIIPELLKNHPDMHALVLRKVGNTIKDSVYAQLKWAISKLGLDAEFRFKSSPFEITYKPTGQKIYFRGADDPLKIKSIKPEFGYIGIVWFEELDQFAGPEEVRNIQQSAKRTSLRASTRRGVKIIGRMSTQKKQSSRMIPRLLSIAHTRMFRRIGWVTSSSMTRNI